jgi:hypothetical protein
MCFRALKIVRGVSVYSNRKSLRVNQSQKNSSAWMNSDQRKKYEQGRAKNKETLKSTDLRVYA